RGAAEARPHRARTGFRGRAYRPRGISIDPPGCPCEQGSRRLAIGLPGERLLRARRVGIHRHAVTYLVDANVLSEAIKPQPDSRVIAWLRKHEAAIVVDPIILGEIRFGILLLPRGKRRARLEE